MSIGASLAPSVSVLPASQEGLDDQDGDVDDADGKYNVWPIELVFEVMELVPNLRNPNYFQDLVPLAARVCDRARLCQRLRNGRHNSVVVDSERVRGNQSG